MSTKICVCSAAGEPTLRTTWSGTTANLCRLLDERSRLHSTVNSEVYLPGPLQKAAKGVSKLLYGWSFGTDRGVHSRRRRARTVEAQIKKSGATDVLHTGTLDLPAVETGRGVRHYLYCDATWDAWRRGLKSEARYQAKLLRDVERLEHETYQQMTHIFPIGEYVRESLITHYGVPPERVTAVGTGCGAIQPYTGEKTYADGYVLFVAKANFEDKGGPLLMAGFRLALQRNPKLRLKIVGDPRYQELIGDLPNTEMLGFVPLDELQTLFNEAALFAMPAVNEPWGLVYLEALSCRTPLLALKRNSIPEIAGNGAFGWMLEKDTPEALADALVEAFNDPARLARMGAAGQAATLARYTWERTVGQIVGVVDRCAALPG